MTNYYHDIWLSLLFLVVANGWCLYPVLAFSSSPPPPVIFPNSQNAMIRQAAAAISSALWNDSLNLQQIRLPLSEAMYGQSEEGFVADRAIGWQGGPQETYRFLSPLVRQLLQSIQTLPSASPFSDSGLIPRITEQVLLDFDGSALLTSESPGGPLGDAQALVQPNTDSYYRNIIKTIEEQLPALNKQQDTNSNTTSITTTTVNRLFLLVNPAWRDAGSFGIFNAKQAQKEILDRYEITYAVDQFVVRGQKCSLLKVWPHDWCVFWSKLPYETKKATDDNESGGTRVMGPQYLGSFPERPSYEEMDELLRKAIQSTNKSKK